MLFSASSSRIKSCITAGKRIWIWNCHAVCGLRKTTIFLHIYSLWVQVRGQGWGTHAHWPGLGSNIHLKFEYLWQSGRKRAEKRMAAKPFGGLKKWLHNVWELWAAAQPALTWNVEVTRRSWPWRISSRRTSRLSGRRRGRTWQGGRRCSLLLFSNSLFFMK